MICFCNPYSMVYNVLEYGLNRRTPANALYLWDILPQNSKMSTRSRDMPKKPVISKQKLKSWIGHVQSAETD